MTYWQEVDMGSSGCFAVAVCGKHTSMFGHAEYASYFTPPSDNKRPCAAFMCHKDSCYLVYMSPVKEIE